MKAYKMSGMDCVSQRLSICTDSIPQSVGNSFVLPIKWWTQLSEKPAPNYERTDVIVIVFFFAHSAAQNYRRMCRGNLLESPWLPVNCSLPWDTAAVAVSICFQSLCNAQLS